MQQPVPSSSRQRSRSPVDAVRYRIGPQGERPSSPVRPPPRPSSPVRPPPRAAFGNVRPDLQSSSGEEQGDVREQWRQQGKKKNKKKKKNTKELIRENELMKNKLLKHLLKKEEITTTSDSD